MSRTVKAMYESVEARTHRASRVSRRDAILADPKEQARFEAQLAKKNARKARKRAKKWGMQG